MEIVPIKQFVRDNISEFRLIDKRGRTRIFDLYDKNKKFCGHYSYFPSCRFWDENYGGRVSISALEIFDGKLNKVMQNHVCQKKDYVEIKDHTREIPVRAIPKIITTTATFFDFINDKFSTLRRESTLQNDLVRIGKDDKDFIYNEDHIIYEELDSKPVYEQKVEVIREGSISEVKNGSPRYMKERTLLNSYPFMFW